MSGRRTTLEKQIQRNIEADLGAEPDLLLLRNSVGKATFTDEEKGEQFHVPYGLGVGSPDLVGILRLTIKGRVCVSGGKIVGHTKDHLALGVWFCLEVKAGDEDATDEQKKVHAIWRRFGALVFVVHSVAEARAALEEARRVLS